MEHEWEQIASIEEAFVFLNPDTSIQHQMYLLRDEQQRALLYYADIQTPVCIDSICKPLYIELYWNLVGQYVGYGLYEEQLLTKFDHEVFEAADYTKLENLLLDPHSILDRKKLEDLYDKQRGDEEKITFQGIEVDAVSGATKAEIKNSVVEGALYSCYTLWHLVHGDAAKRIKNNLNALYTDSLAKYFLNTLYEDYQQYALKQLKPADFINNKDRIFQIIQNSTPLLRAYVFKKMPKELFKENSIIEQFYRQFSTWDMNTKMLLIRNLEHSKAQSAEALSSQITAMSKNQLKLFLKILDQKETFKTPIVLQKLREIAVLESYEYSYLVQVYLNKR